MPHPHEASMRIAGMETISEKPIENHRRTALLITVIALVIVYILWNTPQLSLITYPLRLFVTFVHESGHSLAALITGGRILGFIVSPNGSGLATTAGGWRWLVIPAGYIGAALFGSLLFYVVNRYPKFTRYYAVVLGLAMSVFTLIFARPDEQTGLPLALLLGVGFGVLIMVMGLKLNRFVNILVLNVLAVMTALNAVLDVWSLTQYIDATRGTVSNDAVAFSEQIMPILPPTVVAFSWAIIAAIILGIAVWFSIGSNIRGEINQAFDQTKSKRETIS